MVRADLHHLDASWALVGDCLVLVQSKVPHRGLGVMECWCGLWHRLDWFHDDLALAVVTPM